MKTIIILDDDWYTGDVAEFTSDRAIFHNVRRIDKSTSNQRNADLLRNWMDRNAITQHVVAGLFNVNRSTVYRWLRCITRIPDYVIEIISKEK